MQPSLSELKVIPSFCSAFKIPDDVAASNKYTQKLNAIHTFIAVSFSSRLVVVNARLGSACEKTGSLQSSHPGWLAGSFRLSRCMNAWRKEKRERIQGHWWAPFLHKYIHIPSLLCCEEHNIHWLYLSRQKTHSSALHYTAKISFHLGFCLQPNRLSKRKAQVLSFHFDL